MRKFETADVGRDEFRRMHAALKELPRRKDGERESLMGALAAYIDPKRRWPDPDKVDSLCRRFHNLMRPDSPQPLTPFAPVKELPREEPSQDIAAMNSHLAAMSRQTAPPCAPPQPLAPAPAVSSSGRGFPPDWRAAYVHWGVEMRKELADDEAALKTFRRAEAVLWKLFEAEVEGRLP